MEFVDTHCHIQEATSAAGGDTFMQEKWLAGGFSNPAGLIKDAADNRVTRLICVGCTLHDSKLAIEVAQAHETCWASIGIHPHEAKDHLDKVTQNAFIALIKEPKVVAIGECGLDYFYTHSPKTEQLKILEFQLQLAQDHKLPLILHIREAFDDFWPLFDQFKGLKGVVHSFSAHPKQLDQALQRGLYIGLNGIMTFTKDQQQLAAAKAVPVEKLLLDTDAPFLTPAPYRGKICEPKHVRVTAEFLAGLRGERVEKLADATTHNALTLFNPQKELHAVRRPAQYPQHSV
jgi:TatD DNase family protein